MFFLPHRTPVRGKLPCLQSVTHQVDDRCLLPDIHVGRWMGDNGGATGDEAAKPVAAILVFLSTLVGLKPLYDFGEGPSSHVCGGKNGYC